MSRKSEHKSEHRPKNCDDGLSLGAKKSVSLPMGNLISLVVVAAIAGSAYWNLSSTVTRLEGAITAIFTELKDRKEWTYEEPLTRLLRLETVVERLQERLDSRP